MNWQSLDVQPFDPENHRAATIERRLRLMGKPNRVKRWRSAEAPFNGVQHDAHVKEWQKWQLSMPIGRYSRHVYKRCIELGANYLDIIGPTRHLELIPVRHLLMWELRYLFDPRPSFPEIGLVFKREHTTVYYAVDKVERQKRAVEP